MARGAHGSSLCVAVLSLSVGSPWRETRLVSELRLLGVEWDGNSKTSPARYRVHPMRAIAPALAAMMLPASLSGAPRARRAHLPGPDLAVIVPAVSSAV